MKKLKKMVLGVVTVLVLALPSVVGAEEISFSDVPVGNSHHDSIMSMAEKGYLSGYEDGTFKPNQKLSRVHSSLILGRVLDLPAPKNLTASLANFRDVNTNHQYANQIASVYEAGIFRGNNGMFLPSANLTREQMATVLVNVFDLEKLQPRDVIRLNNVSRSHMDAVSILVDHGLTNQLVDFRPKQSVTRAQFATFVNRAIELGEGGASAPVVTEKPKELEKPKPTIPQCSIVIDANKHRGQGDTLDGFAKGTGHEACEDVKDLLGYVTPVYNTPYITGASTREVKDGGVYHISMRKGAVDLHVKVKNLK